MQKIVSFWNQRWQQPWIRSLMYITMLMVLPEYLAPVMAVLAVIAAGKDARTRGESLSAGSFMLPLLCYIAYMCIGLLYSVDRLSTLASVGMWCVALLLYITLVTVVIDRKRLSAALAYVALGIGCNGLVACAQYLLKASFGLAIDMQGWKWLDRLIQWAGYPLFPDFGNRAAASFTNPNILAEFFIIFLPFLFYYLSCKTNARRTITTRIGTVAAVFGLLFTFCRGAYLALILIAALFLAMNIRKAPFLLLIALSVFLLIPSSVYSRLLSLVGAGEYVSSVVDKVEEDTDNGDLLDSIIENAEKPSTNDNEKPPKSMSERLQVWMASLDAISKKPLFGYGSGGMAIKSVLSTYEVTPPHSHNLALQLLLEGGLLGLGLWLAIAFSAIRKGYRLLLKSADPQAGMAVVAFVCGFCTISMTDYPFLSPKLVSGVLLALALIEVCYRLYTSDKKIRPLTSFFPFKCSTR